MLAAFTIITTLTGCKNDGGVGRVFKYDISANPTTLDPQQADESNSITIIENMFMGLMTIAQDGSVQYGAATEYTVSEDGLTYNFKLRDDIYWID